MSIPSHPQDSVAHRWWSTWSTFKWMIGRRGLSGVLRWFKRELSYHIWLYLTPGGRRELCFDRLHSVVTDAVSHEATRPSMCLDLISLLPIDHSHFTFIDIGSGNGRPLLLALQFPFKRIIGVEADPQLTAVACQNTASHDRIEVVCADAAEYELPHDELVIYLYNPFGYPTFRTFLAAVEDSFRTRPRQILIVYYIPACVDLLIDCGWLEKVASSPDLFAIYRTKLPERVSSSG